MNELTNTTEKSLSILDGLAMQAKMFVSGMAMNLLQLGRVLTEAKPLVDRGQWESWVNDNACISLRKAEQYMQAYATFGDNADIAALGTSKVLKLLPMPEAEREDFLEKNDVSGMTVREMDEKIKAAKAEGRAEAKEAITQARKERDEAERRAEELAARPPEIPEELTDRLKTQEAEIARQTELNRELLTETAQLRKDYAQIEQDMQEQQEAYNRTQEELLDLKSAQKRGGAERKPANDLTLDAFSAAVREFVGLCARMPYMTAAFSAMDTHEKQRYDELLRTVEGWAANSRRALDTYAAEGGVIS